MTAGKPSALGPDPNAGATCLDLVIIFTLAWRGRRRLASGPCPAGRPLHRSYRLPPAWPLGRQEHAQGRPKMGCACHRFLRAYRRCGGRGQSAASPIRFDNEGENISTDVNPRSPLMFGLLRRGTVQCDLLGPPGMEETAVFDVLERGDVQRHVELVHPNGRGVEI